MKAWSVATIVLVGLLTGLSFAHVLEKPAKLQYAGGLYVTLQRTLYLRWGPPNVGGFLEPAAILAAAILAFRLRRERNAFRLALAATAALLLAFPLVFFWLVEPANAAFRGMASGPLPDAWQTWRAQWERGHTLRFGLQLFAFTSLVAALAWGKSPRNRGA